MTKILDLINAYYCTVQMVYDIHYDMKRFYFSFPNGIKLNYRISTYEYARTETETLEKYMVKEIARQYENLLAIRKEV